jgi:hypothetical protein
LSKGGSSDVDGVRERRRTCTYQLLSYDSIHAHACELTCDRAFSSFPDTSLFAEGSIMFSFKIRHIPPEPSSLRLPEPPSPMPNQVDKMEEAPVISSMDPTKSSSSSSLQPPGVTDSQPSGQQENTGTKAEEYRKWNERGREWVYGYVWFEQRKDHGITRGYMQVSHPWSVVHSISEKTADGHDRNHS